MKLGKVDGENFKSFLKKNKNIFYCTALEGDYDCICYFSSSNPEELGKIYSEIFEELGDSIELIDLLIWDKVHKYVQFPGQELEK